MMAQYLPLETVPVLKPTLILALHKLQREGSYVASCLGLLAMGQASELKPFSWKNLGMLAYVGDYQGLADFPTSKLQGFKSWILWRSVYFTKLGSWRARFQVPFDWMRTFIWGRDVSQF